MAAVPEVSVIIASYNSRRTIEACLASLENQNTVRPFEVIVVDSSTDGAGDLVAERFPGIRLLRFSCRKYPGDARNEGLECARAPVIAFTDADCVAREDYIGALAEAHRNPAPAIGGAIGNHEPACAVSWASYLCEFTEWMPGGKAGPAGNLAAANASYKSWVFDVHGKFLEGTYGSDTEFNSRLTRAGNAILWSPAIGVAHQSIGGLGHYLQHEFSHSKDCCRVRLRSEGFSPLRRYLYALATPLIAVKLFLRLAVRIFRKKTYVSRFLLVSPLVAAGITLWSAGELVAFLRPEHDPNRHAR